MKKEYYNGDDGVFYDMKMDEIFYIEWRGDRSININTYERTRIYFFQCEKVRKPERALLAGMHHCIRLGDL